MFPQEGPQDFGQNTVHHNDLSQKEVKLEGPSFFLLHHFHPSLAVAKTFFFTTFQHPTAPLGQVPKNFPTLPKTFLGANAYKLKQLKLPQCSFDPSAELRTPPAPPASSAAARGAHPRGRARPGHVPRASNSPCRTGPSYWPQAS